MLSEPLQLSEQLKEEVSVRSTELKWVGEFRVGLTDEQKS